MHISYSGLSRFKTCPRSYKIKYKDGVEPEANIYSAFGKAVHSTCEFLLQNRNASKLEIKNTFTYSFKEERREFTNEYVKRILNPVEEKDRKLKDTILDMSAKGAFLATKTIEKLEEVFPGFEIIATEDHLEEDIVDYEGNQDFEFKGYVDVVLKYEEIYCVIDFKTCSWGWPVEKKSNTLISYQLSYYKHFISLKYDIDPKKIFTYFVLIKRTAFDAKNNPKKDLIEVVHVSNKNKKISNALNLLNETIYNIDNNIFPKNKMSCEKCEFHKTKWCS